LIRPIDFRQSVQCTSDLEIPLSDRVLVVQRSRGLFMGYRGIKTGFLWFLAVTSGHREKGF
jgi:hypothetical protein